MDVTSTELAAAAIPAAPRSTASRRSQATRARLLESGIELLAEHGLHGVTTHDVARHAGFAAGTFYLHFKDKRALFGELAHDAGAALLDRLRTAVASSTGDAEAEVRAHAEAMLQFAEEQRALIRILFSADADAAAVGADLLDELAGSLSTARTERGLVPPGCDATVLSQAVVGMFARVVAWWAENPSGVSREDVVETLVRIQLYGTRSG